MMSMLQSSERRTMKPQLSKYVRLLAQLVLQMYNLRCFEERPHLILLSRSKFLLLLENLSLKNILKVIFSKPLQDQNLM
ncbi:hypothetical protein LINPERHAP1_LOCUS7511 [Linum perenne]